ncbi:pyridoxal-phosphate dependent enzyme [Paraburkholderia dipogonis]|uniref:pyridoxal-phosphate dependent enzyme n=1 Tax=Paraburkholderia dipogonis TaxID=1211383 RepID=UPI0035EE6200
MRPRAKIEGARSFGATVRLYDRRTDDREAIGRDIAVRTGAITVPPYDDPYIMAGQGTVGLENRRADERDRRGAELRAGGGRAAAV